MTFFFSFLRAENIVSLLFPTLRKWSNGIFFLSFNPKLCLFLFHVNLCGFLFFSPVSSWVLTKWPPARGGELWPLVSVQTGAGCRDLPPVFLLPSIPPTPPVRCAWVLPRCCRSRRRPERLTRRLRPSPFHRLSSPSSVSLDPVKVFFFFFPPL